MRLACGVTFCATVVAVGCARPPELLSMMPRPAITSTSKAPSPTTSAIGKGRLAGAAGRTTDDGAGAALRGAGATASATSVFSGGAAAAAVSPLKPGGILPWLAMTKSRANSPAR